MHRLLRRRPGAVPTAHGISVVEVNQPDKAAQRRHGKTDMVDAEAAARAVLSGRATSVAKTSDGAVEMRRVIGPTRQKEPRNRWRSTRIFSGAHGHDRVDKEVVLNRNSGGAQRSEYSPRGTSLIRHRGRLRQRVHPGDDFTGGRTRIVA